MQAQDILPDGQDSLALHGIRVRKGTVGAFLANARLWSSPLAPEAERRAAEQHMADAMPALMALGLFEVFEIRHAPLREWVATRLQHAGASIGTAAPPDGTGSASTSATTSTGPDVAGAGH